MLEACQIHRPRFSYCARQGKHALLGDAHRACVLQAMCEMLTVVGKKLEEVTKDKKRLDGYFAILEKWSKSKARFISECRPPTTCSALHPQKCDSVQLLWFASSCSLTAMDSKVLSHKSGLALV